MLKQKRRFKGKTVWTPSTVLSQGLRGPSDLSVHVLLSSVLPSASGRPPSLLQGRGQQTKSEKDCLFRFCPRKNRNPSPKLSSSWPTLLAHCPECSHVQSCLTANEGIAVITAGFVNQDLPPELGSPHISLYIVPANEYQWANSICYWNLLERERRNWRR